MRPVHQFEREVVLDSELDSKYFRFGLDLDIDVHISLPLEHPVVVLFVLLIISMVANNNQIIR
jgi:hypothetical protein